MCPHLSYCKTPISCKTLYQHSIKAHVIIITTCRITSPLQIYIRSSNLADRFQQGIWPHDSWHSNQQTTDNGCTWIAHQTSDKFPVRQKTESTIPKMSFRDTTHKSCCPSRHHIRTITVECLSFGLAATAAALQTSQFGDIGQHYLVNLYSSNTWPK